MLEQQVFDFLTEIDQNNHKDWFLTHRQQYQEARENFIAFCSKLLEQLKEIQDNLHNTEINTCILRINRDLRFSKDKRPYKNYFAAGFGPGGRSSGLVDFYFQVAPDSSFLGAGMWQPSPKDLAIFRQEVDYNPETLKSIINSRKFKQRFPIIHGTQLKTKPKGYSIDHPEIELLRYKELFFTTRYSNSELKRKSAPSMVLEDCKLIKPYQDYLNQIFSEA